MTVRIELNPKREAAIKAKAEAAGLSIEDYLQQMIDRDAAEVVAAPNAGGQPLLTLIENLVRGVQELPQPAFDPPRPDGATQHDHYIYGTPKRDDL